MRSFRALVSGALLTAAIVVVASGSPSTWNTAEERTVQFTYQAIAPTDLGDARDAELWLPLPLESPDQVVSNLVIDAPVDYEITSEERFGNRMIRLYGPAKDLAGKTVSVTFEATRRAIGKDYKQATPEELAIFMKPNELVPTDGIIAERAEKSATGGSDPLEKARALYDDVVGNLEYDKSGEGWGRGDAIYACNVEKGNCTDYHSLFIGMCRSLGLPARFTMGVPLPMGQSEGTVGGYHCWAEFYVEGQGWVPVDASEASKHPERSEFLFGHLDADRIEFCRGRDIVLPGRSDALNYFIYPVLFVDGSMVDGTQHKFAFRDLPKEDEG